MVQQTLWEGRSMAAYLLYSSINVEHSQDLLEIVKCSSAAINLLASRKAE